MNLQQLLNIHKSELLTAILLFVLVMASVISSRLTRLTSGSSLHFETSQEIIIQKDEGLDSLFTVLDRAEVNYDREEMMWAARLLGWRTMQRGRYEFEGDYSYNAFLSKMARGIQDPVNLVVLPGSTLERLAETAGDRLSFSKEDFISAMTDSAFLAEKALTKEQLFGHMLPETYLVYWTSSAKELVKKINGAFNKAITQDLRNKADSLGYNIEEIVALASIVEWEAKNPDEKDRISGLYWNRLNRRMRLQADPTVNFALGERRRLLFEDYEYDHPYNTYVNRGLPPGPITNPSLSTIKATLYPEQHDYLYMVANPEGGHVFSKTFAQHQKESEKWRIWLRKQYRIKRDQERAEREQETS